MSPLHPHPAPSLAAEPDPVPLLAFASAQPLSLRAVIGAIRAGSGFVHSTRCEPDGPSEIDLEFPRCATLDLYTLLIAVGLELDCASHLRLTSLCQCARDRAPAAPSRTHSFTIRILPRVALGEDEERFAWNWLRANRRSSAA